jgi:hypothetical protein
MYRYEIINSFIKKYEFKDYLEIGVFKGECIREIECENKDGVDPGIENVLIEEVNYPMGSNEFFNQNNKKYDIVFIDGLHHSEQVDLDIKNALKWTNDNGVVLLHDCNPPTPNHAAVPQIQEAWNGDVYKSVLKFQKNNKNYLYYTIDTDWGVGVIVKNKNQIYSLSDESYESGINNWDYFDSKRNELLNLISVDRFLNEFL